MTTFHFRNIRWSIDLTRKESCSIVRISGEQRLARFALFRHIWLDVRFALRTFASHPAYSAVVVLTLALGIGVNTAIFSAVNGVLLRPLAFDHPDQLVRIWDRSLQKGVFDNLRPRLQSMEIATYARESGFNLTINGESTRVVAGAVSWNLFSLLGVKPQLGRDFGKLDEAHGVYTVIISHNLWQTQFGGDRAIIGKIVVLDGKNYEIVGVMPPGFHYPVETETWAALGFDPSDISYWGWGYNVIGRLRPGSDIGKANAEFRSVFPGILKMGPYPLAPGYGSEAGLIPLKDFTVVKVRTMLLVLLGAVSGILLVACVNVANLMLARATARQKEMAVRAALGASRRRIGVQLLTESVLLGMAGGTLGLLLGWISLGLIKTMLPADTPRLSEISMDGHVLLYSILLSFVVGLVFGMVPAIRASRPDIEQVLRANAQTSGAGSGRSRASAILVVAEVAMAVILVSGAGLLVKSLWRLNRMDTGVRHEDQLLIANVTPSWNYYQESDQCAGFYRQMLDNVRALPGVESAALADTLPMENLFGMTVSAKDRPESITTPYAGWGFEISPGYFETMGIPLLKGRDFTPADKRGAPGVLIISRSLARQIFPEEDPIGKPMRHTGVKEWSTVVGVVEDVLHYSPEPIAFNSGARGDVYVPSAQGLGMLPYYLDIVVRGRGDVSSLRRQITVAIAQANAGVPVSKWRTMRWILSQSISKPRSTTWMFVICASLALLLGLIGIYSVISYTVTYRTREIGVRMALGADRRSILWMMVRSGAILTATGLALGIACALALTRLMSSLLYGVTASDPMIYIVVAVFVAGAALLATFIPSLRATRVEPTVALRCE